MKKWTSPNKEAGSAMGGTAEERGAEHSPEADERVWMEALAARFPGAPPGGLVQVPENTRRLDSGQLRALEQEFRRWAEDSPRADVRASRLRILWIFLIIRYTGARLSEVLDLDLARDLDPEARTLSFGARPVRLPEDLAPGLAGLRDGRGAENDGRVFRVDPAHVRRKFYGRAEAAGIPKELAAPAVLRRSRAVELLEGNVPLPVVQSILGHSTPGLAASWVEFSGPGMDEAARRFLEKESQRKTSARNRFFGSVVEILQGDIQSLVRVRSLDGLALTTIITNTSRERLGLLPGALVTAEVKAPWVIVARGTDLASVGAENRFSGTVESILRGEVTTEIVVRLAGGARLCSLLTEHARARLDLREGDTASAFFSAHAVVLNV
jgi:molybdate transport system regulatory protein